ncbi:carbohydrate-binding domain-containing protein [Candidatus Saccharibacteria bacterium]|nr:carbohydrate-binding domain-containing protein [Candidatus Saccharibacteria bacterium]
MQKSDKGWIFGGILLLLLLIMAVVMNVTSEQTNTQKIVGTIETDYGDLKINWERYPTYDIGLTGSLTITDSGTYHITGTLEDGLITVKANHDTGKVRLILDNVSIKNSSGPAIACYSADDLVIELVGENYLEDGAKYSADFDEDVVGAIYSKDDLTFQGEGSLTVTANFQDGIVGKDDLKFNSGTYYITAADDGIRGKDSVYIVDGHFAITARGDGIKSSNDTDRGKGFVLIESGEISISSGDDGIHAEQRLVIKGGKVTIEESYEGLEARVIAISGGEISVRASDDGINAGGGADTTTTNQRMGAFDADESAMIIIDGGEIYVNAAGDGIDSNGYVYFNGGKVIVDGPTNNGNGALDAGIGIIMNGGEAVAVGASGMAESLGENSTIYNISVYFASNQSAKTKISIKNSAGEMILEHTSAKAFNHLAAGSEKFKTDETYTIYINDEKYTDFTISSTTTMIGNTTQNRNNNQNMMNNRR